MPDTEHETVVDHKQRATAASYVNRGFPADENTAAPPSRKLPSKERTASPSPLCQYVALATKSIASENMADVDSKQLFYDKPKHQELSNMTVPSGGDRRSGNATKTHEHGFHYSAPDMPALAPTTAHH